MENLLITGGAGYFGSHFVEYLLSLEKPPARIVVFSRDWHKHQRLSLQFPDHAMRLRFYVGDIRDPERLWYAMDGIDTVVHAAALKAIDVCDQNPWEAIATNVVGSRNVFDAAIRRGVGKVLALSSDKAPLNITLYGATKALMEYLAVSSNVMSRVSRFSVVRYGNVTGSDGSVIPVWKEYLRQGKSIPVTDPAMTRFHFPIGDVCVFVQRCLEEMRGGEIFVPKLGAYRLGDLADAVTEDQEIIGIRGRERKHEVLLTAEEAARGRDLGWSYVIPPLFEPQWEPPSWEGGPISGSYSSFEAFSIDVRGLLDG